MPMIDVNIVVINDHIHNNLKIAFAKMVSVSSQLDWQAVRKYRSTPYIDSETSSSTFFDSSSSSLKKTEPLPWFHTTHALHLALAQHCINTLSKSWNLDWTDTLLDSTNYGVYWGQWEFLLTHWLGATTQRFKMLCSHFSEATWYRMGYNGE